MAAIEYRGSNAVTNFDLSRYIKSLCPRDKVNLNSDQPPESTNGDVNWTSKLQDDGPGFNLLPLHLNPNSPKAPLQLPKGPGGGGDSSALGLLLQSSKYKEMLEKTSAADSPSTPPESDQPRRSFPEDIQTYFDYQDSGNYTAGDDIFPDDLNSIPPIFRFELDA